MGKTCFYILTLLFSVFLGNEVQAQNLVPNPSFEEPFPKSKTKTLELDSYYPAFWEHPTRAKPDYYVKEKIGRFSTDITGNLSQAGWDYPRGHIMAGIMGKSNPDSLNQYLQVKLKQKLINGESYCITFLMRPRAYWPYCSDEIDYCLSSTRLNQRSNSSGRLLVSNYKKIMSGYGHNIPPEAWQKVHSCYTATGGEEYLTIGFINPDFKIVPLANAKPPLGKEVYFFIDEVSLVPMADILNDPKSNKDHQLLKFCDCNEKRDAPSEANDFNLAVNKPLILKNINFEIGKAKLLPTSLEELNPLVSYLKADTLYKIEIYGHTDTQGNEPDNKTLSLERAESLANYLISAGINSKRISFTGHGSQKPIKPNDTEENRLVNRRVEIKLVK